MTFLDPSILHAIKELFDASMQITALIFLYVIIKLFIFKN